MQRNDTRSLPSLPTERETYYAELENDIAALLTGKDAILEIELAFRSLRRRGAIDDDDWRRLSKRFDQVYHALALDLEASKTARGGRGSA